jgi:protein-S-isoprenylcysteine O-methyltransferase Ste14
MGIGTSLVLIAVGAILAFAVNVHATISSTTIHWHAIGWILLIVGVIGLVFSLIWMAMNRRRDVVTNGDYVDRGPVA